ncbi:hybrid sensor histidine kinase/response regulator [Azospirillum rugosum]|uniref:histidine kinase n=1 Tax=Azospirillum rugosum TaxID=416170 RepID=A0ABS4STA4_9PROT|nr:hybrid sensor histidine kinase/response regulator [Azospirillum rugosum]MBP2295779.1 signal transduction histidine kinase [Azospirillum rugosum]MDQ0529110.1 signal transduction histidine kinase [Azospirillum rugosum]
MSSTEHGRRTVPTASPSSTPAIDSASSPGKPIPAMPWTRLLRSSRPLRRLLAGGVLAVLAVAGATALIVVQAHDSTIRRVMSELETLDLLLAETTSRSFQTVDLILASLVDQLESEGVTTSAAYERSKSGYDTYEMLKAKATGVPQLDAITMIAADGRLINFSRYFPIPPVNVADRDYYGILKNDPDGRSYLSTPVQNRGNGEWTVYLAHRVSGPSGEFVGLVLGAISLNYFQNLYQSLQIGGGSAISLWRRDGTLLARYPTLPLIGERPPIKSFTEILRQSDSGVYETPAAIDGPARIVATRLLRDYPVVVNVTRTKEQALADWRRQAWITVAAGILCELAFIAFLWGLARQFGAYEAFTTALAERNQAIEARREAEARLNQAQKMETLGQLTGGIAHDFNNLLQAIGSALYLIEQKVPKDGARSVLATSVRLAAEAVERGAALTQHLLAFSRRQHLEPRPVDVNALITGMSGLLGRTLGGTVAIGTALQDDLWPALVDPTQLEMALLNLSVNARDAMPGGGTLCIATANLRAPATTKDESTATGVPAPPGDLPPGDYVGVSVRDSGTGMDEDVAARAFEPFFTTKEIGRGTGLGLSMVHGLSVQSGGGVRLDSRPGLGTTVTIYLPRAQAPSGAPRATDAANDATAGTPDVHVLLVDDDTLVRQAVSALLRQAGLRVAEASDTVEALAVLAGGEAIDLMISDIAMPGMNGFQLATAARARRPNLPVLLISGYAEPLLDGGARLEAGACVLNKPFKPEQLLAEIRALLP